LKLAEVFVRLADSLVDDYDIPDLLHELATQCVDLLGAEAAGLMLADVATIAILQERLSRDRAVLGQQLQHALNSRVIIQQAKGRLSASRGIGLDEAFEQLRHQARSTQRRIVDVATEVLHSGTHDDSVSS
jgi:ANTAR domain